jgi:exodeoxyribonuclease V alpha subunit
MNAAIPERRPATEEISGLIERVTFHNDESGFCVLRVKARGQRDETTVVGALPSVTAGEWLSAEGSWVRDKEHGLQFKASTMETVPPGANRARMAGSKASPGDHAPMANT